MASKIGNAAAAEARGLRCPLPKRRNSKTLRLNHEPHSRAEFFTLP